MVQGIIALKANLSARKMKTDLDVLKNKDILAPVVFRSYFNKFEKLDVSQAWSLAFSGGQEDKLLDAPLSIDFSRNPDSQNPALKLQWGNMFTNTTVAIGTIAIVWCIFSNYSV